MRRLFFFIERIPNFHSNNPSSIFCRTDMCEILRIARSSFSVANFFEESSALIIQMEKQGGNKAELIRQILKTYENHLLVFHRYDRSNRYTSRIC